MQIIAATKELEDKFSNEVPELVWATGPISYDYHFASRDLFEAMVVGSWQKNGHCSLQIQPSSLSKTAISWVSR